MRMLGPAGNFDEVDLTSHSQAEALSRKAQTIERANRGKLRGSEVRGLGSECLAPRRWPPSRGSAAPGTFW